MCSASPNRSLANALKLLLGIAASLAPSAAFAQSDSTPVVRKATALKITASPNLEPTAARLESSRRNLLSAFHAAEAVLRQDKNIDLTACQQQLRWAELSAAISSNPPHLPQLQELSPCFYGVAPVLERPAVLRLREALAAYIQTARLAQVENFRASYHWHSARLTTQLASDRKTRDEDILRRHVAWMHSLPETPVVAKQASQKAAYPNFVVAIRKDLLKPHLDKLNQQVKQTKLASNVIVGAMVTGHVHANGRGWPVLNFEDNVPKLRLHYAGKSIAPNSQAVSGPVTIRNHAETNIEANADIHWNGQRLVAHSTVAHCTTKITQLGLAIDRPRLFPRLSGGMIDGMVESVALRRISEQRGQAERETSQLTERDVTTRMNAQVSEIVASANAKIEAYFAKPATRAGIRPTVELAINKEYVTLGLTQFDVAQMAADTPAAWKPMAGGTLVGIHQSALTGFTQKLCGGAVWRDRDFSDLQRTVMGIRSAEMKIGDEPRWALQLDWLQPFSMHIDRGGIQFTIRAQSITYNGQTLNCPIRIAAKYTLKPADTTLNCLRQGNVEVACLAGAEGSETVRKKVANFLNKKFSCFFQEHIYLDGLTVPTGERWDSMTTFFVREVQSQPGWLYLAIQRKDSDATRLVNQKPKLSATE